MTAWLRERRPAAVAATAVLLALAAVGVVTLVQMASSRTIDPTLRSFVVLVALGATGLIAWALRERPGVTGRRPTPTISLDEFLAMSPARFERSVAEILGRYDYDLAVTGGPGDLAADLLGTDPDGLPVVVQCKRWERGRRVGSGEVQKFIGMGRVHHGAEVLIFVTTADYGPHARALAQEHGVILVNGAQLVGLSAARASDADPS